MSILPPSTVTITEINIQITIVVSCFHYFAMKGESEIMKTCLIFVISSREKTQQHEICQMKEQNFNWRKGQKLLHL